MKKLLEKINSRKVLSSEKASRKYARRSMYTCKDIKKNEQFTIENIIPKRPGIGITPIMPIRYMVKKLQKIFLMIHVLNGA